MNALLRLEDVHKEYGDRVAVDGVSLTVDEGEVVALVGESGCGKSTLLKIACGLVPCTRGRVERPEVGRDMQVVLQDAGHTLSPRWTVAETLAEPWILRGRAPTRHDLEAAMARVQLASELASRRPHELSGGQKQRVALARALAFVPRLLLLDEPLAGLDVSVAAQLLALLESLRSSLSLSMLVVTHDLWAARRLADRIGVMAGGALVEMQAAQALFESPKAQPTRALLEALPGRPSA